MGLILKPFCSSSRSKMSRGRGSPKRRLGHQDDYQLTEVLSQVALQIPPAPTGQRSSGLIQVKSGLNCQMLTAGCWKGQRSDKGFGKRNGFFNFVSFFEKYTCCRNPISHGESCLNNTGWGEMPLGTGGTGGRAGLPVSPSRSVMSGLCCPARA